MTNAQQIKRLEIDKAMAIFSHNHTETESISRRIEILHLKESNMELVQELWPGADIQHSDMHLVFRG